MAKSLIIPYIELKPELLSIKEVANNIIKLLYSLAEDEDCFNCIYFISKSPLYEFIEIDDDYATEKLAEEILLDELDDIQKIDKVESPDISYSRKNGFIFSLQFKKGEEKCISLNFKMGASGINQIGVIALNPDVFSGYSKFMTYLRSCVNVLKVNYGVLKISEIRFAREVKKYKSPLGWVTYFSKDYEIPIPDDLEGIKYEHTDKGKYLILSREDITTDPEKYEAGKQKLLGLMEEIKQRVPEYLK